MKFRLFIDKEREEEVTVCVHKESMLTDSIRQLCEEDGLELIGYKNNEGARLEPADINCFIVEDNKIFALTDREKYQMKLRLYRLEEILTKSFVKINQSCIANIKKIERFDASFSGSLTVRFKNGYTDYVSRRNLKNVKERLGL